MSKYNLDFFPSTLLNEAHRLLGEEFARLPKRIQTGYVNTFFRHHNLIKHNKHSKDSDSFSMSAQEVIRHFSDARIFNSVNKNGYWLKPKSTRHGVIANKYSVSRKEVAGSIYCEPTNWLEWTIVCSPGGSRNPPFSNGYQLSPKIKELVSSWLSIPESSFNPSSGLVNRDGDTVLEVEGKVGGGIVRELSTTSNNVNVNVLVFLNKTSLLLHKEQLKYVLNSLVELDREVVSIDSPEYLKISLGLTKVSQATPGRVSPRAKGGVKVKTTTTLALQSLLQKDLGTKSITQRINLIDRLLVIMREERKDAVPVFYEEVRTGRYTTQQAILQGYTKSVRYAALAGCYEYDIEAAHQNILVQLLEKNDVIFPELNAMKEYIANKTETRISLSKKLNTTIGMVKSIIQALTYGAQLSTNSRQALYKQCNGDMELLQRVVRNPWLMEYASAFTKSHKALIGSKSTVCNAVGIIRDFKRKPPALAHLIQGYERQVLDVLIASSERDNIALLIHDCIVFYTPKSTSYLSEIVEKKTGFKLSFSEEKY